MELAKESDRNCASCDFWGCGGGFWRLERSGAPGGAFILSCSGFSPEVDGNISSVPRFRFLQVPPGSPSNAAPDRRITGFAFEPGIRIENNLLTDSVIACSLLGQVVLHSRANLLDDCIAIE